MECDPGQPGDAGSLDFVRKLQRSGKFGLSPFQMHYLLLHPDPYLVFVD
jgi:hypothetical protein